MHILFLFEISKFYPFTNNIHFYILVFIFIFLNFIPIILFPYLVHLIKSITFLTEPEHIPSHIDKYTDVKNNNENESNPASQAKPFRLLLNVQWIILHEQD